MVRNASAESRFFVALVAVVLPWGCESAPQEPEVDHPAPGLAQIHPDQVAVGSPSFTLHAFGEGFVPESIVQLAGSPLPTTFVSRAELRAVVPDSVSSSVTSLDVMVSSPPPGGGESTTLRLYVETVASPSLPRITGFDPWAAAAGDDALTLRIRGSGFTQSSQVRAGDVNRSTTYVHSGELRIDLSDAELAAPGAIMLTVADPVSTAESFVAGFPVLTGGPPTVSVDVLPLTVADVVADPFRDVVYVSVPQTAADSANTVLAIDPFSRTVLWSAFVGSDPRYLSVSHDGAYLYASLEGAPAITRLLLPSGDTDLYFEVGDPSAQYLRVRDLTTIPDRPESVVASLTTNNGDPPTSRGVWVYDDGVRRVGSFIDAGHIAPSRWSSRLYAYYDDATNFHLAIVRIQPHGLTVEDYSLSIVRGFGNDIAYDQGLVFAESGEVIDPESLTLLGTTRTSGVMTPDVARGRAHWFANETLTTFHHSAFVQLGTVSLPEAMGSTVLERFGDDGLVLGGGSSLVFLRSDLVGP